MKNTSRAGRAVKAEIKERRAELAGLSNTSDDALAAM
jgi:hypothetical protein